MPIYSHSRLSTFEQCKLKFKFAYIDKVKPDFETTIEAFMGSLVHDTLEKLYKDLRYNKLNDLRDLLLYYNNKWDEKYSDAIKIVKKDYTAQNYKEAGQRFIGTYYGTQTPFDKDNTIATEQHVMIELEGGKKVQGYIDRLSTSSEGIYCVHDYKTGNSLPPQKFAEEDRQLALYSIAVRQRYKDCRDVKLFWHYLSFNKILESQRTLEQLEELKQSISNLIDAIESESDFAPSKSALCNWCQFKSHCPLFKHQFAAEKSVQKTLTANEGVKLVDEYAKLKEQQEELDKKLDKIKEALIDYASSEGINSIFGSSMKATLHEYEKLSFPKKEDPRQKQFLDTIKKIGLWDRLAMVDVYELAKMINRKEVHEELLKLMEKFIDRKNNKILRLSKK